MLNAMPAANCRITSAAELEHEYQRAKTVYRIHCATGDIPGAMVHLSNAMRIWRSLEWVRQVQRDRLATRADRLTPSSFGPERTPFSGTWQPGEGGLS